MKYLPAHNINMDLSLTAVRLAMRWNREPNILVVGRTGRTTFDGIIEKYVTASDIRALSVVWDRELGDDEWYIATLRGGIVTDAYGSSGT